MPPNSGRRKLCLLLARYSDWPDCPPEGCNCAVKAPKLAHKAAKTETPERVTTRGSADELVGLSDWAKTLIPLVGIVQGRAVSGPGTCRRGADPANQKGNETKEAS